MCKSCNCEYLKNKLQFWFKKLHNIKSLVKKGLHFIYHHPKFSFDAIKTIRDRLHLTFIGSIKKIPRFVKLVPPYNKPKKEDFEEESESPQKM